MLSRLSLEGNFFNNSFDLEITTPKWLCFPLFVVLSRTCLGASEALKHCLLREVWLVREEMYYLHCSKAKQTMCLWFFVYFLSPISIAKIEFKQVHLSLSLLSFPNISPTWCQGGQNTPLLNYSLDPESIYFMRNLSFKNKHSPSQTELILD